MEGDLQDERLGLTPREFDDLAADVGTIFHLGADVRFDQALEAARAVQVGGSLAMSRLALASLRRGEFARFHHVSTFAAGRRSDVPVVPEEPPILDRSFRNTYEQSKAEAESVLLERAGDLPLTIHRVGIVVGDSRTGWTSKFDAFYMLMRLLLELEPTAPVVHVPVPGRALLNAVPIDFTTDALFALGQRRQDKSGTILHYTAGRRATPVHDALALAMAGYRRFLEARGERPPAEVVLVPVDDMGPESLADSYRDELPSLVLEVIQQLVPYGFDDAAFDNHNLLAALEGTPLEPPPMARVMGPIVDYPLRTHWGAPHEPRPPLGRLPV